MSMTVTVDGTIAGALLVLAGAAGGLVILGLFLALDALDVEGLRAALAAGFGCRSQKLPEPRDLSGEDVPVREVPVGDAALM